MKKLVRALAKTVFLLIAVYGVACLSAFFEFLRLALRDSDPWMLIPALLFLFIGAVFIRFGWKRVRKTTPDSVREMVGIIAICSHVVVYHVATSDRGDGAGIYQLSAVLGSAGFFYLLYSWAGIRLATLVEE